MASEQTRELDYRAGDGLEVKLLWSPQTNQLSVTVFDSKTGDDFKLEVSSSEALDAFHHPYAYAANHGVEFVGGVRVATDPVYA
jgi:hypothetical protein